jgi:hypothetical protein
METGTESTFTMNVGEIGAPAREKDVRELVAKIAEQPDVHTSRAAWDAAHERFEALRLKPNVVNRAIKETGESLNRERAKFAEAVYDTDPVPTDVSAITRLAGLHAELVRTLDALVLDRCPRAEVAELLSQAEHLEVTSRALSVATAERMERTLKQLAPALAAEQTISIDLTRTLSGALQRDATRLLEEAGALRQKAAEILQRFNLTA